jgi:hypothetical protein
MILKNSWPFLIALVALLWLSIHSSDIAAKNASIFFEQQKEFERLSELKIKKITQARDEEKRMHEELMQKMKIELENNRKDYEKKLSDLKSKKESEVSSFSNSKGGNPALMAKELSKATGFKIYNEKKD